MNANNSFVIAKFTNPSRDIVFRVSGWLDGRRVRKNFATRAEAEAERQVLEVQSLQGETAVRTAITRLTDEQLHEAEAAFLRLKVAPQPLLVYLECGLANYRESNTKMPLAEAVAEYVAAKQTEVARVLLSERQLRSIKYELESFKAWFPSFALGQFSTATLPPYLERGSPSLKTYNNRRGVLSTFFKFAHRKDWIAANPVEKTPHHRIRHRRGSATTITAEQAAKLMAYVETFKGGAFVPYFALCLFAGIRPSVLCGEIAKLRPEHVRLDTGVIHIEPDVSKVRMKRNVSIQPNLAAWLRAYPLARYPIIPINVAKARRKVFEEFGLTHDVLRHTFISMFVARFRSIGEAALQAGNSEGIICKHYLDLKSQAEAEQFFSILPKREGCLVVTPTAFPVPAPALAVAV
jgi:integrase